MIQKLPSDQTFQVAHTVCVGNALMSSFCFQPDCSKSAILCQNKNTCKCYQDHASCFTFVDSKKYLQILQQKRKPLTQPMTKIVDQLDELFEKTIEQLSQIRQFFHMHKDKYGLSQKNRELFMLMQNKQFTKITGKYLNQITSYTGKISNLTFQQELRKSWPQRKAQFFRSFRDIQLFFEKLTSHVQSLLVPKLSIQSNIIQDAGILQQFLNDGVRQFRMVYRYSQNNGEFGDLAGHLKHTITLIHTQIGTIFGGYNPQNWTNNQQRNRNRQRRRRQRQDRGQFQRDTVGQSFIFSYTNKQKFPIVKRQQAFSFDEQMPGFGYADDYSDRQTGRVHDFKLYDERNRRGDRQNIVVSVDFPVSYNNGKHIKGYQAIKALSGGYNNHKLKVKQWEVFQVIWLNDQKNEDNGSEIIVNLQQVRGRDRPRRERRRDQDDW